MGVTAEVLDEANRLFGLGDIALKRSEHDAARRAYEEARLFYQRVGNIPRQGQLHIQPWRHRATAIRS